MENPTYQQILTKLSEANPEKTYRELQKEASEIHQLNKQQQEQEQTKESPKKNPAQQAAAKIATIKKGLNSGKVDRFLYNTKMAAKIDQFEKGNREQSTIDLILSL